MNNVLKHLSICMLVILIVSFFRIEVNAAPIEDSTLHITYIGATGYLIESATKKILIEPTYGDIVKGFGYPYHNEAMDEDLVSANGIFDSIDLVFISHIHPGHFDAEKTALFMESSTITKLITTGSVQSAIQDVSENYESVSDRIVVMSSENFVTKDTTVDDIYIEQTMVEHWGDTKLLQHLFEVDGLNIAFYLDSTKLKGKEIHVQSRNIDLGFIDGKLFLDEGIQEMYKTDFEIGLSILTHSSDFAGMTTAINDLGDEYPQVTYLPTSMEKFILTFSEGTVQIDTLNRAPMVVNPIPDDTLMVNESYLMNIPVTTFSDGDGEELEYDVKKSNGSDLPEWLSFNENEMTLSGTPPEAQKLFLQVIATDPNNSWGFQKFILVVESPMNNKDLNISNDRVKVYPSMAVNTINIDLSESSSDYTKFTLINSLGVVVQNKDLVSNSLNQFEIQGLPKGRYFVVLQGNMHRTNRSFIKL